LGGRPGTAALDPRPAATIKAAVVTSGKLLD
jgi:hypothetical protein